MTNTTTTLSTSVLEAVGTFKKALAQEQGAITGRATARAKQAVVAFGIGQQIQSHIVANSADVTAEAVGLDRAKVLRIGYMGRVTKGLETVPNVDDAEQVAALAAIWQVVSGSKGLKAPVMDSIGARKFGTVEALAEAVKEAAKVKAPATPEQALKAFAKALEMLDEASVAIWTDEQRDSLDEGLESVTRVLATVDESGVATAA